MVKVMLEYLSKINKARSINKSYHVNDRQALILDYICEKHLSHKACHIKEIILLKTAGSQATLHAVTKELTKLNLIKVSINPVDSRIKNVLPTPLALNRLKALVTIFEK
jgi:DNA-binding MarR family transcriptional regulator